MLRNPRGTIGVESESWRQFTDNTGLAHSLMQRRSDLALYHTLMQRSMKGRKRLVHLEGHVAQPRRWASVILRERTTLSISMAAQCGNSAVEVPCGPTRPRAPHHPVALLGHSHTSKHEQKKHEVGCLEKPSPSTPLELAPSLTCQDLDSIGRIPVTETYAPLGGSQPLLAVTPLIDVSSLS